jgi:hypothetical protein
MVLSLRLFLSLFIVITLVYCTNTSGTSNTNVPNESKAENQIVVAVVDKSQSVTFNNNKDKIQQELKQKFDKIYKNSYQNIQYALLTINNNTRVIPDFNRFHKECPNMNPESRSQEQALEDWQEDKKKWLNESCTRILNLIQQKPSSNSTDIFGIFSGVTEVQKTDGPWDKIEIVIFSDMIHTLDGHNMMQGLTTENAYQAGKNECQTLLAQNSISKANNKNLHFTIYTPDKLDNSGSIRLFWKGFFEKWGLTENQWQFE